MTDEQKKVVAELVGRLLGQVAYYKIMRKTGAPKYFAYFASTVTAHLVDANDPIKPRVEKAFEVKD